MLDVVNLGVSDSVTTYELTDIYLKWLFALSRVRLFATAWTAAYQAPPSMGFSRQEYWSGVPSPSPFAALGGLLSMSTLTKIKSILIPLNFIIIVVQVVMRWGFHLVFSLYYDGDNLRNHWRVLGITLASRGFYSLITFSRHSPVLSAVPFLNSLFQGFSK